MELKRRQPPNETDRRPTLRRTQVEVQRLKESFPTANNGRVKETSGRVQHKQTHRSVVSPFVRSPKSVPQIIWKHILCSFKNSSIAIKNNYWFGLPLPFLQKRTTSIQRTLISFLVGQYKILLARQSLVSATESIYSAPQENTSKT